ncbi:unannotated protein [freshwater metagenome]|uniref:Unannotated protein n=1 Tax=freshwater metagenome TaxID=449393 RepID=A0A6J7EIA5_9ZZZZ|nr:hypothetical protein [Actinomycetota bacterium]
MSSDEQDIAEASDDEMIGLEAGGSDEVLVDFPPERPVGLPFADADVTDESLEDRLAQEEPEVWESKEAGEVWADRHDALIESLEDDAG